MRYTEEVDTISVKSAKAFIVHNGRVLIIRESPHEDHPGMWDLPGGRPKDKESLEDALRREVMEETGLAIEVGERFFETMWDAVIRGEKMKVEGAFFVCEPRSTEALLSEDHDAFLWIDPRDAAKHALFANVREAFEAYVGM